ncbi:MAG: hypothetical protein H7641_05515, partial [Candidatus Heimdallarchaeota archaeon]|nr:hypothetical protein [Candidatus Heimdallarchaeota archaeon]MCK4877020.1 hypothetical protein [Candidatus Heimdallarchaeota archaeon]
QNIGETLRSVRREIRKFEFSDKVLDLISIIGVVLFMISFISVFLSKKFNIVNIVFMLYPLAVGGLAAAFRMKRRDKPEETPKMFREWLIIMGSITAIGLIMIIIAHILF